MSRYTRGVTPVDSEPYRLPPFNLFGDNQGVAFTVQNPLTSSNSRHLDVKWFRLREFVKERFVRVFHIFTHQNAADFFTKPLDREPFQRIRRLLMNYSA